MQALPREFHAFAAARSCLGRRSPSRHPMVLHNLTTERPNYFTNHPEIKQYVHTQTTFFKWHTSYGNSVKPPANFLSSKQNGFSVRKWQRQSELLNRRHVSTHLVLGDALCSKSHQMPPQYTSGLLFPCVPLCRHLWYHQTT